MTDALDACLTCSRVLDEGWPVLYVGHDHDGAWQFLCGGSEHDDANVGRWIHSAHLLERDASLAQLGDLPVGQKAERTSADAQWVRSPLPCYDDAPVDADGYDADERKCIDDVARFGLHIMHIDPGEDDDGFSFSIGLFETFEHPDVIVFGQQDYWRGAMLNALADEIRAGRRFEEGPPYDGLIGGYSVVFRALRTEQSYENYLGWNVWYYHTALKRETRAPVLQLVWPDLNHIFPGSPGYDSYRQPLLD